MAEEAQSDDSKATTEIVGKQTEETLEEQMKKTEERLKEILRDLHHWEPLCMGLRDPDQEEDRGCRLDGTEPKPCWPNGLTLTEIEATQLQPLTVTVEQIREWRGALTALRNAPHFPDVDLTLRDVDHPSFDFNRTHDVIALLLPRRHRVPRPLDPMDVSPVR